MSGLRKAIEAKRDEWALTDANHRDRGGCPDGYCGDCTLAVAAQDIAAILAESETNLEHLIRLLDPEAMRGGIVIPAHSGMLPHETRVSAFAGYEHLPLDHEFGFSLSTIRQMLAFAQADR